MQKTITIKTEAEYDEAVARLDKIFGADDDTPVGQEALAIVDAIEAYDNEHYPMEPESVWMRVQVWFMVAWSAFMYTIRRLFNRR